MSPEDPRCIANSNPHTLHMNHYSLKTPEEDPEAEAEAAVVLTDGMTPFDILSSVFGSTLTPSEL